MKYFLEYSFIFPYMIVFARFAGFFMFAPLFHEPRVNLKLRVLLTLGVTVVVTPVVEAFIINDYALLECVVLIELMIGLFAALIARILLAALDVAGSLVGFQMSLANASVQSVATAQQTDIASLLLTIIGAMLIFATDFHHTMILLIIESYKVFSPAEVKSVMVICGDMGKALLKFVSASFMLALQIAAPITIFGLIMFLAAGLLNRIIPQIQIFFILQPIQILLGFAVLVASLTTVLSFFISKFAYYYKTIWNMG